MRALVILKDKRIGCLRAHLQVLDQIIVPDLQRRRKPKVQGYLPHLQLQGKPRGNVPEVYAYRSNTQIAALQ